MIGIIVTGHGQFASGLVSSLELIAGTAECLTAVDFSKNCSSERLEELLRQAASNFSGCSKILFLTDLAGGSPFRCSAMIAQRLPQEVRVLTGTNLAMLLESVFARSCGELQHLADSVLAAGQGGVQALGAAPRAVRRAAAGGI